MINKAVMSRILNEEVIYISGCDVEKLTGKIIPTQQKILYMIPTKNRKKALSRNINADEMSKKCIIWAFKQGYNIDISIEDARWQSKENVQFRAKVTPTSYRERAFISENSYDCVFAAVEFIMNEIDEEIDDLFARD